MSDSGNVSMTVVEDFASSDDFAKKHTPFVTLERGDGTTIVDVEVGHEVPHPNGPDHYITSIALFVDGVQIARVELEPSVSWPHVRIPVSLAPGTVLRAVEHCNLHGWWAFDVTL